MTHLPFTLLAYFFNSISVTINKILLKKTTPDPFVYIFYVSIFSLILIPTLPFTHIPDSQVLILASVSSLLWTFGAYFMFHALKIGLVSRVIPVIGTLIPLILFFEASGNSAITINQAWAVFILILGMIFITILDWKGKVSKSEVLFEVLSAAFFAISYILLRQAYLGGDFFSVLVWSRVILILLVLLILITPQLRKKITSSNNQKINLFGKNGILFLIGQASGGAAEILLLFSISLASPALVNSLQGTQYIFLIFFGLFLKEKYTKLSILTKLTGIIFIALGLYVLTPKIEKSTQIGITFSPRYTMELGLEPKNTFTKILEDFKIKYIRLPVYWDEIEKFPNDLNFSSVDYYLEEAGKKDVSVILSLGYKQPRWPECFDPPWIKKLIRSERDLRILKLIQAEIEHFKNYQNIIAWQVENEPFLPFFGNCDPPNEKTNKRVKQEIAIVKNADNRPILITDSGELGFWNQAIANADIFGTTLYRTVWNPILGSTSYPLPPVFYNLKNDLIRAVTGKKGQTIISELQMEPWIRDKKLPSESDLQIQIRDFPPSRLSENLKYAQETNFSQIYLWGVEWWYFMDSQGYPEYLKEAKLLMDSN